jgi:hypothetical protein
MRVPNAIYAINRRAKVNGLSESPGMRVPNAIHAIIAGLISADSPIPGMRERLSGTPMMAGDIGVRNNPLGSKTLTRVPEGQYDPSPVIYRRGIDIRKNCVPEGRLRRSSVPPGRCAFCARKPGDESPG